MGKCVYNHKRKGKRECPALDGKICSRCCGRHRLTDIECPSDCRWLQKAMADHREKFFSSSDFRESRMAGWLHDDLMSGAGVGIPGGQAGLDLILRFLDVVHWRMNESDGPESYEKVVDDAVRYLEQTHTGQLMSPESPPSSLARALDDFLDKLFDTGQPSEQIQKFKGDIVECVASFFEWCDERGVGYFETLDEFYSSYNLEGWTPVEERGGEFVVRGLPGLEEEGEREASGPERGEAEGAGGPDDSDLIVPGS